MSLQSLAVIFIIIVLPISMVLTVYVQNQVETLELQVSYDTKLMNATYDALKAFQLNTVNSSTSDLSNSKIRDIQASVNTFFNSIASNFNMAGYNKDILQDYVPALVYTMYDGYYIYSPFTNTLDDEDNTGTTYHDGDKLYNLKPYIHYSVRYKSGSTDVVITYTLDNYITVEGYVNGTAEFRSGYLLDNVTGGSGGSVSYRGIPIYSSETLREDLGIYQNSGDTSATIRQYRYIKMNGVKYYLDESTGEWFSILGGEKHVNADANFKTTTDAGYRYYNEAKEFTTWVRNNLGNLKTSDAVDEDGTSLRDKFGDNLVFDRQGTISIEDENSLFNQQRLAVIRYSIEKNLSIAIANYNDYSGVTGVRFAMPTLAEDEWEKILNNVSIISFMQGLSIGGKLYNGYSIVTNTKTEEVVNLDSIYITTGSNEYHRVTDSDLISNSNITGAFFNVDFERKSVTSGGGTSYFYPHRETGSYSSIVTQTNNEVPENIYEYVANLGRENQGLASAYFTALGRERYSMYRTNNNAQEILKSFTN